MSDKRENMAGSVSGGIQSVDVALRLVGELAQCGGPVTLSELARRAEMPPSKAHRYLASFIAAGLVVQAGRSGKYDLGPAAMEIGLAALARHDFVNRSADALPELRDATGMTVLLSVWGTEGATVVRWERAPAPVITSMGLGTTLPLLTSASGRIFLAWSPPGAIGGHLEKELALTRSNPTQSHLDYDVENVKALRERIREAGFATVDGRFIPGLVAVAAPVLDWQGEAQCAITLIGTDPAAIRPDGKVVSKLLEFCHGQSVALQTQATG
ncbi:IclR family transcriptional regulator [uncultured Nitratireductor sp.]|uniref:IclR family transcriptional regulator n=1 Tax=uncultured Nitratireductor sp. TaxID=520953 RepID=UPI0025D8734B|nr:IclR family transcriptional regulator [uncultured Nitratireductor sp.]